MWCRTLSCVSILLLLSSCVFQKPEHPPPIPIPQTAQEEMEKAKLLEERGEEQEALTIYKDLYHRFPHDPLALEARFDAAIIFWRRGYLEEALDLVKKVNRKADPDTPLYHQAQLLTSWIYYEKGDTERALQYLSRIDPSKVPRESYNRLKNALTLQAVPPQLSPTKYQVILFTGESTATEKMERQMERGLNVALKDSGIKLLKLSSLEELNNVEAKDVLGIVGPLNIKSLPELLSWAQEKEIPVIAPSLITPHLAAKSPVLFRTSLPLEQEASYMATFLSKKLKVSELGILYPNTPYGRIMYNLIAESFPKEGGLVTIVKSYPPQTTDFSPYAQELKEWKKAGVLPQALYIPDSWKRVVLLIPQLVFRDVKGISLAGASLWDNPKLPKEGGDYVEYSIFTDSFNKHSSYLPVLEFCLKYRMRYGKDPSPLEAQVYDAGKALLASVKEISKGKSKIKALANSKFIGVTGITGFDTAGEPHRTPFLFTVERGTIHQLN